MSGQTRYYLYHVKATAGEHSLYLHVDEEGVHWREDANLASQFDDEQVADFYAHLKPDGYKVAVLREVYPPE